MKVGIHSLEVAGIVLGCVFTFLSVRSDIIYKGTSFAPYILGVMLFFGMSTLTIAIQCINGDLATGRPRIRLVAVLLGSSILLFGHGSLVNKLHDIGMRETSAAMLATVHQIESLRSSGVCLPPDQASLEKAVGSPLPLSAWGNTIEYSLDKNDCTHFRLHCLTAGFEGRIFEYDSRDSEKGIQLSWF